MVLRKPESGAPQQALWEAADLLLVGYLMAHLLSDLGVRGEEHQAPTTTS